MGRHLRYLPSAVIVAAVSLIATGCPIRPNPPPVVWINQCPEFPTNPGGFTRPVPTNHPITTLIGAPGYTGRWIMWINRTCDRYYLGPIDYPRASIFCQYRPDIGDKYYGDWQSGAPALWIRELPVSCGP